MGHTTAHFGYHGLHPPPDTLLGAPTHPKFQPGRQIVSQLSPSASTTHEAAKTNGATTSRTQKTPPLVSSISWPSGAIFRMSGRALVCLGDRAPGHRSF
jgi:hypothetical protein